MSKRSSDDLAQMDIGSTKRSKRIPRSLQGKAMRDGMPVSSSDHLDKSGPRTLTMTWLYGLDILRDLNEVLLRDDVKEGLIARGVGLPKERALFISTLNAEEKESHARIIKRIHYIILAARARALENSPKKTRSRQYNHSRMADDLFEKAQASIPAISSPINETSSNRWYFTHVPLSRSD